MMAYNFSMTKPNKKKTLSEVFTHGSPMANQYYQWESLLKKVIYILKIYMYVYVYVSIYIYIDTHTHIYLNAFPHGSVN